ncbi:nucleoside triphosphate pyrophosphohydrolase [Catenulispora sp. NF23]|uniref:Nucleoside triphosphate pyrophosphohydrolase n=1 Tax=Catenulispora pinistramenti TaxID=2705254 RepID=A0ABS5L503_9ACTN|nr:nucleoside triphosphate pyrophosphohydrolase [Catenulispora pinistramenti]MBS2537408.1 nucleoside triphosphate pyrophosphohydrolase [Catenulispora pinistramenti]MBS2553307.1 nucleoside triphosphate pyrophosphohydrolase [Catenulispora pinistramenti]
MTEAPPPAGRIVFLATSPRVALGLLSWPAWEALRAADVVFAGDADHPHIPYVEQATGAVVALPDHSPAMAAERLLEAATPARTVVWLAEDEEYDEELAVALGNRLAATAAEALPDLEVLPGSYDLPGAHLLDLVDVMNRLRSPGGCPWDAEQTHASLVKYLLEEAYETVETIEDGDPLTPGPGRDALREELGDVLLQVMFHSRIAEEHEADPFSVDDVADGIVAKLIRRHPHVFGDVEAPTAEHVAANWDQIKAQEKQRTSVTEGVPTSQPALSLIAKLAGRVGKSGLEVPVPTAPDLPQTPDELGEQLLATAVAAVAAGWDPEEALRTAARRYRDRIITVELELARG